MPHRRVGAHTLAGNWRESGWVVQIRRHLNRVGGARRVMQGRGHEERRWRREIERVEQVRRIGIAIGQRAQVPLLCISRRIEV